MIMNTYSHRGRCDAAAATTTPVNIVETIVYVIVAVVLEIHFFFFGEAAFFDFGEDDAELEAAGDFAVFGLGAFGFFVGPALFDFLAFEGDFGFAVAEVTEAVALEVADLLSPPAGDLLDFTADTAWTAELFFSAAVFFVFGELFFADDLEEAVAAAAVAADFSAAARLAAAVGAFLAFAAALFFFSAADGFAAPDVADANLNEPEAPFPFV